MENPNRQQEYINKLLAQNQEMRNMIAQYNAKELLTNQTLFNQWVMEQIEKIKDGINQLMEAEESSEESEEESEEVNNSKPVEKESTFKKLTKGFRRVGDNLSQTANEIP